MNNLYNLDQISRFSYIKKEISASDLSKIDSVNFKMFIDLYNQFGFPSELIVGRKNFKKVLLLLHHFSYEKKFFDTLEPILLDEYFNNVISHQVISYVFDMYYERCEKSYYFCNTILFKDKRKELKPDFFNNSCTYDSINMNRFMYGLIPLRYHLKAVKRVNKKNVILSIINLIFNPPHYIYNGHWVYNYSYKIDYEITKSKNTILNYKCL